MDSSRGWLLLGIISLILALLPMPYAYYSLLRIFITGLCLFIIYEEMTVGRHTKFFMAFGFMALIYNPVLPVSLNKGVWVIINLGSIVPLYMYKKFLEELYDTDGGSPSSPMLDKTGQVREPRKNLDSHVSGIGPWSNEAKQVGLLQTFAKDFLDDEGFNQESSETILNQMRKTYSNHDIFEDESILVISPLEGDFQIFVSKDTFTTMAQFGGNYIGTSVYFSDSRSSRWSYSIEPTPASGLGIQARKLGKFLEQAGSRDINLI